MGILRFLLALAVILTHTGGIFKYSITGGTIAVQTFFLISGYLICLVLMTKYNEVGGLLDFYKGRFLRIFPSYWLAAAVMLCLSAFAPMAPESYFSTIYQYGSHISFLSYFLVLISNLFIFGQDIFLFLSLNDNGLSINGYGIDQNAYRLSVIPPAWSLSLELLFYAIAPFIIRKNIFYLISLITISILGRIYIYYKGFYVEPWTYRFFPFEVTFFLLGAVAFRIQDWNRIYSPKNLFFSAVLVAILTLSVQPLSFLAKTVGVWPEFIKISYILIVFSLLPNLAAATRRSKIDNFIGNLSYPMYIFHWIVVKVLLFYGFTSGSLLLSLLCATFTIAISTISVLYFEPIFSARKNTKNSS